MYSQKRGIRILTDLLKEARSIRGTFFGIGPCLLLGWRVLALGRGWLGDRFHVLLLGDFGMRLFDQGWCGHKDGWCRYR